MKILFVANRIPYPPYRGDKLKIYNLAKRLCTNNELYLITFAETKLDLKYKAELENIFKTVKIIYLPKWKSYFNSFLAIFSDVSLQIAYFKSNKMKNTLEDFVAKNKIDVIHTQHLRMAQFTSEIAIPRILDLPDAFSLYWKRRIEKSSNFILKIFQKIEFNRIYKYEKHILSKFNLGLVCSKEDLNYLKYEHKSNNVAILRNGVDLELYGNTIHNYGIDNVLLFTGNMNYAPNVDAVVYFTKEIFPLVLKIKSDVIFVIAGQKPVKQVRNLACSNIVVTGFVKNLGEYYSKAAVVVSSLRFGAGTQNKVIEAMAMGIPVVCTNVGFEGLEIENGMGAFMETDPQLFAAKIIELLDSKMQRETCGIKGKEIATSKFNWDIIATQLEKYCQSLTKDDKTLENDNNN
ncbi:MAG: glycosyltransferase [Bacteroidetes bacterium]|nr:glycosyltransferase [Bacteroidota bacterium]